MVVVVVVVVVFAVTAFTQHDPRSQRELGLPVKRCATEMHCATLILFPSLDHLAVNTLRF